MFLKNVRLSISRNGVYITIYKGGLRYTKRIIKFKK